MAIRLGINNSSLKILGELSQIGKRESTLTARLSSGLRINDASDDPAGLALATALSRDVRVYSQAIRNVNDGVSALSIIEGAVGALSDIVGRLQELAAQAANGAYTSTQRSALNTEARSLVDEYNRIMSTTTFNGMNLLDGSVGQITIQAGYGVSSAISITLPPVGSLGLRGDGTFSTPISFGTGNGPYEVISADFNGDGILDLAAAALSSDRLDILIGNGDGSFLARRSYIAGDQPDNLSAADFNNDGHIDVVTHDAGTDNISVFLNNGNGTFLAALSFAAPNGAANSLERVMHFRILTKD